MENPRRWAVVLWVFVLIIFLFFQSRSIFGGDAGDLVAAVCVGGVAHPPGYPLYTFLGRLANLLPFFTPAWRVSLLSSLPASIVVVLIYWLVGRLTESKLVGLAAALSLAFSYLFWLYAEIPEVFSLNNLFLISLTTLTIDLITKMSERKLRLFFFLAGLSLSHHHFSLWFYPVFFFFIWWFNKKYWQKKWLKKAAIGGFFFFLGLLPYLYVPLTARHYPVISWNNPTNLKNFIYLITRAEYGTFLSHGASLGVGIKHRLLIVYGFFLLFYEYFGWLGILLLFLGFLFLFKKEKKVFGLITTLFLWELVFMFYSGFSLSTQQFFVIGVYERFLLPGMIYGAILMGCGLCLLAEITSQYFTQKLRFQFFSKNVLFLLILLIFFLYPLSLFIKNAPVFFHLKNDLTAENFASNILNTLPYQGILLITFDNPLFDTQYVHYCLNQRPDVSVLHPVLLEDETYYPILKKRYSHLAWPDKGEEKFLDRFLELNYSPGKIYTNYINYFKIGAFIPIGVLYQYFPSQDEIPSVNEIYQINKKVWDDYQDPLEGILSWFQPSTLASVLYDYHKASKNTGIFLFESGEKIKAKEFFEKAMVFNEKNLESKIYLVRILIEEKNCLRAEEILFEAAKLAPNSSQPYFYLEENSRVCWQDEKKAKSYEEIYLQKKRQEEGDFLSL